MTVTVQQYVSPEKNEGAERSSLRRPIYLSFLLLIIAMPLVILLLQGSGYAGTMDDTQLGFNAEIIKIYFSRMTPEGILLFQLGNLAPKHPLGHLRHLLRCFIALNQRLHHQPSAHPEGIRQQAGQLDVGGLKHR